MNLLHLSWKNLRHKPLSTSLSLTLLSLSVSLISLVGILGTQIEQQMTKNITGIDMVVGAKGSPLQLILSSVYHIDYPTGNISLKEAEKIAKNPFVKKTIPLAYGDSYKGFRIVGCRSDYENLYNVNIATGKVRQKKFEVNIGANVADKLLLKMGDTFVGVHGLIEGAEAHESHHYEVVGIFEPTNTVIDQLILTDIESVWAVHAEHNHAEEHEHEHGEHCDHDHEAEDDLEITAMLVQYKSPMAAITLPRMINEKTNMQAAVPAIELNRLFTLLGTGVQFLQMLAIIIMIVAGISIFVALFNSLQERRYEMALMRTMGASRFQLAALVLSESGVLTVLGLLIGFLFSRIGLKIIAILAENAYGYSFEAVALYDHELFLIAAAFGIGIFSAILPAWQAYRLNISATLAKH
jgi:putative ABC transport system permease protein